MSQEQPIASSPASGSESKIRPEGLVSRFSVWSASHPVLAIVLVSLLAVIINCYPVVFCGKSFVSPMSTTANAMVYNWWPPLPGMEQWSTRTPGMIHSPHGSDTEAMMWWGVPVGFIESRSLLEQGELPLWNRYSHGGDTLIGQAISMLGDPLQFIVILGHGSAVAWDIKFLTAKFLFCVGFGLLTFRLGKNRPLSLIYSALAAYCGAYFYINNHPAFFVLTYAPWILLAALEWLDLDSLHPVRWGLIWLLANFACFNAGHVEVAVVLIGGLNLAAVACALIGYRTSYNSVKVLVRMGVGTLIFLGLTAPVWMSFLVSLNGSYTTHDGISVSQLPPTTVSGAFDDLFYLMLRRDDSVTAFAPGSSLLILAGCCFSIWRWRQLKGETFFWINTCAIVLWGGCIFGGIPSSLIAKVPLLNRVGHNFTDFSYLLVIHLTIQSAYGFLCLINVTKLRQLAGDIACLAGVLVGFFALYSHGYWHQPIPWNYFLCAALGAAGAPLLFVFLKSRQQQTLTIGWAGIIILGFIPNFRFGLYTSGNDALLLLPGPRTTLNSPSKAIDRIKTDRAEPFRVVGLQWNFMGDYSAVYGLEDIRSCAPVSSLEFVTLLLNFPGMDLSNYWMFQVKDPIRAQCLLNLLNVKYLLTWPDISLRENTGFRITDRSDFGVLENEQAWPRAFFASQVASIASTAEFIPYLVKHGQQPFIALTETEIKRQPGLEKLTTTNQPVISSATNYRLGVNSTGFDIHAPAAGVVCLSEGQAKDFTAMANNEAKEVLTVNRVFKGIYLDQPGDYHITFTYRPRHWRLACTLFWISIGGIILASCFSMIGHKRAKDRQANSPNNKN
jgi:hypothetical protein